MGGRPLGGPGRRARLFRNRREAGQRLAGALERWRGQDALVLGLPRGGVVVAQVVAQTLGLPLDVLIARKISPPGNPEYAIGALAEVDGLVLNEEEVRLFGLTPAALNAAIERERREIERRVAVYRGGRPLPDLKGRTAIIVDDGVATGFTVLAAVRGARAAGAARVIVAAPVCAAASVGRLEREADEVVCLATPEVFYAVGAWYDDFGQVSDEEVRALLAAQAPAGPQR